MVSKEEILAGVVFCAVVMAAPLYALSHEVNKRDSAYWELLDSKVLLVHCGMSANATDHYLRAVRAYRAGDLKDMERELELMRADWTKTCRFRLFAPDPQSSFASVSAHYEKLPLERF